MASHDDVKNFWEENATNWYHLSEKGIDVWRDFVNTPSFLEMLPDTNSLAGLDVGCGDGHNSRLIAQRCKSLDAIDICHKFLALAQNADNPPNITYHNVNTINIPFPNEHFDFVVATMSLMDMADLDKTLTEIYRILSPTGFFQFSIIHPCFNEFKGAWVKNNNNIEGFLVKDYFVETKGDIHEWKHPSSPSEIPPFRVPRFLRPLSSWINMLLQSGFMLEEIKEPYASNEAIKQHPELIATRIVAHSLIIRVRKNEQKKEPLRKIVEKLPGNVWWKGKDLKYLGCNDRVLQVLGLNSRREFIGKTDYDLWENSIASKLEEVDLYVLSTGATVSLEEIIREVSGKYLTVLTNKSALHDEQGNIIGLLGTSTDVTELKHTHEKLKEAEGRLEGMTLLSYSIAHELRTPLGAIKMTALALKEYFPLLIAAYKNSGGAEENDNSFSDRSLDSTIEGIERIIKAADSSNQILNMILMNLMAEKMPISNYSECSILECIEASINEYTFPLGNKNKIDISQIKDFKFYGEKNLMKHVFFNLFKNAFYFMEKAGKGEITMWTNQEGDYNQIFFKDTGYGVLKEKLSKIFDKFYTSDTHHGTGIGLAFCKLVMNAIEGDIESESEFGKYTQFTLSFPKLKSHKVGLSSNS